jgi:mono/diheme cytochrome c family protein
MHLGYVANPDSNLESPLNTYQFAIAMGSVVFAAAAVFAQSPPANTNLTDNPVYKKDCAGCHGKTAEGRHFGGPSLTSDKAAAASTDDLRNIITNGKGHMPKFASKLTPEEIDSLVQQIRALNKK